MTSTTPSLFGENTASEPLFHALTYGHHNLVPHLLQHSQAPPHINTLAHALYLHRTHHHDRAKDLLKPLLHLPRTHPHHQKAALLGGEIYAATAQYHDALTLWRRCHKQHPNPTTKHLLSSLGGLGAKQPLRQEVTDLFDHYAPSFEQHLLNTLSYTGHHAIHNLFKQSTTPPAHILDLGCGTGLCGQLFKHPLSHITGVDLSPHILNIASKSNTYNALYPQDLLFTLLSSHDNAFNLIIAADVLGYVGDLQAITNQAARTLTPNGAFVFSVEKSSENQGMTFLQERRFTFSKSYIKEIASNANLSSKIYTETLRTTQHQPVPALIAVLKPNPVHQGTHVP